MTWQDSKEKIYATCQVCANKFTLCPGIKAVARFPTLLQFQGTVVPVELGVLGQWPSIALGRTCPVRQKLKH
eukprot:259846-Amphidinium_carterae.1